MYVFPWNIAGCFTIQCNFTSWSVSKWWLLWNFGSLDHSGEMKNSQRHRWLPLRQFIEHDHGRIPHTIHVNQSDQICPWVKHLLKNDASNLWVDGWCGACAAFKWGCVFMFARKPHTGFGKVVRLRCEIFVVWNIFTALNNHLEHATKALKWQQE